MKVAAGVTDGQFRIDAPPLNTVDPDYSNWQKIHQYKSFGGADLWGELYGREVNHTTLVWYVQDEAVQWLG